MDSCCVATEHGNTRGVRATQAGLTSQLHHLLAMELWASLLTSLGFFLSKMKIFTPTMQDEEH